MSLTPEQQRLLGELAAELDEALRPGGGGGAATPASLTPETLDATLKEGFVLTAGGAEARRARLEPFAGLGLGLTELAVVAWLGRHLMAAHPALAWTEDAAGTLVVAAGGEAPLSVQLQLLVAHATARGGGVSLAETLAAIDDLRARAAPLVRAGGAAGTDLPPAPSFDTMSREEIGRWASSEAAKFRAAFREMAGRNLFFDLADGVAPLADFAVAHRYVRPFPATVPLAAATFLGETARRHWSHRHPEARVEWHWSAPHESPAIAVRMPGEDAEELLYFPVEQMQTFFDSRQEATSLVESIQAFTARIESPRPAGAAAAAATAHDGRRDGIPEMPRDPAATAVRRRGDAAGKLVSDANMRPIPLLDDVAVNEVILQLRRRMLARHPAEAPDLFLPCARDLVEGARLLGVMPTNGFFFETEAELTRQLDEILPRLIGYLPPEVEAHFLLFFSYVEARHADLVVVLRKPLLVGGAWRHDFFLWDLKQPRPGAPLTEEARREAGIFDPAARRVKEALFHLQHTGDATRARELLEEAAERDPDRESVLMAMCQFHLAIGNQITARGYVQAILKRWPANVDARLLDARFLLEEERLTDATLAVDAILRDDPASAEALIVGARVMAVAGRVAEAQARLDRALEIEPNNAEAAVLRETLSGLHPDSESSARARPMD